MSTASPIVTTSPPQPPHRSGGLLSTVALGRHIERSATTRSRLPSTLAIAAFSVVTAALLVTLAGLHAFSARQPSTDVTPTGRQYVALAFAASGLLIAPILTLGGTAARLTLGRRDQRLAAMRLAGATRAQVGAITLAETGWLALRGALSGVLLYAVLVPCLSPLHFEGRAFGPTELIVPWWWIPVVVASVTLLALGSGLVSLARVAVSPLGVAARHTPRSLSVVRAVVMVAMFVAWFVVAQRLEQDGTVILMVVLPALVAVLNAVGPFAMMLMGRVVAGLARGPRTLLAARRIVDDPRGAWRAVGALGLGITVAGLAGTAAAMGTSDPQANQLLIDMRTGALVTLGMIAVIAATSTGVVQAARIIDGSAQLRMLGLAGAQERDLVVAGRREVTLPLGVTVVLACGFCALVLAPTANAISGGTLLWLALAVVGSVALMLAALRSTVPLIRRALTEPR